jgi:hypothetical protein
LSDAKYLKTLLRRRLRSHLLDGELEMGDQRPSAGDVGRRPPGVAPIVDDDELVEKRAQARRLLENSEDNPAKSCKTQSSSVFNLSSKRCPIARAAASG